jgi:hypothetical protein
LVTLGVQVFRPVENDLCHLAGLVQDLFIVHETPPYFQVKVL